MSQPICHFYNGLPGSCRNADSCRFRHLQSDQNTSSYSTYSQPVFHNSKYKYIAKPPVTAMEKVMDVKTTRKNTDHPSPSRKTSNQMEKVADNDENVMWNTYSCTEDISATERAAFESKHFELGSIPMKPPSFDLR